MLTIPENAGAVTIGEIVRRSSPEQCDRTCYLYDYGDEWHFYRVLKSVLDDDRSDAEPTVVKAEGESIDQYGSSRERLQIDQTVHDYAYTKDLPGYGSFTWRSRVCCTLSGKRGSARPS